jgi:hypothetical protein
MPTCAPHSPTTNRQAAPEDGSCLGRTCLHWRADGELVEDDMALVLQRLRAVDGPAFRADCG